MTPTANLTLRQHIHFACLLLMAASLPLSFFGMSVSGILLAANWLISKDVLQKFKLAFTNKTVLAFLLIFLLHLVGLFYTSADGMKAGLNDVKIKLPLLLYPIVLGSSPKITSKQWLWLFTVFIAACLISSSVSFGIYLGWIERAINDFRSYSPFISHIRLSLLLVVAIASLVLVLPQTKTIWQKAIFIVLVFYFICTLNILQSATGFIILLALVLLYGLDVALKMSNNLAKVASIFVLFLIPIAIAVFITNAYFNSKDKLELNKLSKYSANGEKYWHFYGNTQTENGHYVYYNIAEKELKKAWSEKSKLSYYAEDGKGHIIYSSLWRYMSSLNLDKDSLGFTKLSLEDIKAIERGETNCNYKEEIPAMQRRLNLLFEEFDNYLNNQVNGNSLMQRLEYVKTGWKIFKNNWQIGVGTGDLQLAFDNQYNQDNSNLIQKNRLRAHNQYLTFGIAFGIIGFILFCIGFIYPIIKNKTYQDRLFCAFLLVALLSFTAEDTLESQAGVSFFIFFYGIFVWAKPTTEIAND